MRRTECNDLVGPSSYSPVLEWTSTVLVTSFEMAYPDSILGVR